MSDYLTNTITGLFIVSISVLVGVCLMCVCMHRCLSNEDESGNNVEVDATPAVATRIDNTDDSDSAQYGSGRGMIMVVENMMLKNQDYFKRIFILII